MITCLLRRRTTTPIALIALITLLAATASAETLSVTSAEVRITCPLTVGGSFEAKTSALTGEVTISDGGVAGTFRLDLTTLETGIGMRDRHLRDKYLEVGRQEFATALLTDIQLDPTSAAHGGEGTFTGQLTLHGVTQPITGTATITAGQRVVAVFPISIPAHGIKKPRHLGIGVRDQIEARVQIELAATQTTP